MICLGEKQYTELEGLLKLLNIVLVDNNLSPQEKKNKLTEEFSIKMTPRFERGVKKMCNLSEGVEQRGIKKGIQKGREQMATDMAMDMLQDNKPMEEILKYSRLPLERIQELAEQIRK